MNRQRGVFFIDGKPMCVPDGDPEGDFEDLHSEESTRTLDGIMHLDLVREKVPNWVFNYGIISKEDYSYMQSLFANKVDFMFTYPDDDMNPITIRAYRSKFGVCLHNARTGERTNYKFKIISC